MSAADPSRRRGSAAIVQHGADEAVVGVGHAEVEVGRADQRAQRVVGLERRARRADADGAAAAQQSRRRVERQLAAEHGGRASGLAAGQLRRQAFVQGAELLRLRLGRRLGGRDGQVLEAGLGKRRPPAVDCAGSSAGATRAVRTRSGAFTNSNPNRPRSQRNILLTSRLKRPCTRRSSP